MRCFDVTKTESMDLLASLLANFSSNRWTEEKRKEIRMREVHRELNFTLCGHEKSRQLFPGLDSDLDKRYKLEWNKSTDRKK